jgi:hypothetical protein
MIDSVLNSEIRKILKEYDISGLIFDSHKEAGPDEEIYFYHDENGHKFILWSRDFMGKLFYETQGLQKKFGINVVKWFELKDGGSYDPKYPDEDDKKIYDSKGMRYALGLVE